MNADIKDKRKNPSLNWACKFKDPEQELRFIAVKLNQDRLIIQLLLLVVSIVFTILLFFDHMVIKPHYWPVAALSWRGGLVLLCLIAVVYLKMVKNDEGFRVILFVLTLTILANLQGMVLIYNDDYFLHVLFDIIIIIAIYFSTLFSFVKSVVLCITYALTGFFIIYFSKHIDAYSLFIVAMSYVATNLTGIIISRHEHILKRQFFSRKEDLQEFAADMKNKAFLDPLTGISNRRAFYEFFLTLKRTASRLAGSENKVCFVLSDIDFFKKINDRYGHDVGDQVLISFAHFLTQSIRPTDQVFRFGGEEFLIIFVGCNFESAMQRTEELIKNLNENPLVLNTDMFPVTASFGLSILNSSDTEVSVVTRADKALYQAKNSGRNRLCTME